MLKEREGTHEGRRKVYWGKERVRKGSSSNAAALNDL